MKKKTKIILIPILIAVIVLLFIYFFVCPHNTVSGVRPNDNFSRQVVSEIGDDFTYLGFVTDSGESIRYKFFINNHSVDSLLNFTKVVNDNSNQLNGKAEIVLFDGSSAIGSALLLSNYYETDTEIVYYDGFYHLREFPTFHYSEFWGAPDIYAKGIENIRIFEITSKMQNRAVEEGIDWYDIWPDLDELVVYDANT